MVLIAQLWFKYIFIITEFFSLEIQLIKKNFAEEKEINSNQIVAFTKEIKKKPMDFRLKIIEILWKIVYSDSSSDNYESNLMRRICGLLYVSDRDSGLIKERVKNSSN